MLWNIINILRVRNLTVYNSLWHLIVLGGLFEKMLTSKIGEIKTNIAVQAIV